MTTSRSAPGTLSPASTRSAVNVAGRDVVDAVRDGRRADAQVRHRGETRGTDELLAIHFERRIRGCVRP